MSHSYYRQNNNDANSQDSSNSSNSVLDALLAGIGNNQKAQNSEVPEIQKIVTRDPETMVPVLENNENLAINANSVPDIASARIETESDFSDEDSYDSDDDSVPELDTDDDSDNPDEDTIKNLNKCNFVVKVLKPGKTEPETVFSRSGTLEDGEDAYEKLREMTKDSPYGSIVSDLVGNSTAKGLVSSNEPSLDFINEIFGLKPLENKIENKFENVIKNDPLSSYLDDLFMPPPPPMPPKITNFSSGPKFNDLFGLVPLNKVKTATSRDCECDFCSLKRQNVSPLYPPMRAPTMRTPTMRTPTMRTPVMRPSLSTMQSPMTLIAGMPAPRPLVRPSPPTTKKSDPASDLLLGLATVALLGGTALLLSSLADDKKKIESKTETKTESKTESKTGTNVKANSDEESVEISTSRSDDEAEVFFTPEDYTFFKEHFRNFDGDVDSLSPNFQRMYYEVQDELEKEQKEKEEYEANQRAIAAELEKPYVAPVVGYTAEGKEIRLRQDGMLEADTSISGAQFKDMFNNCSLVKLTNATSNHNGFQFTEGLNIDVNEFRYDKECGPDGLYFCRASDAENWFNYGHSDMKYVWDVEIPDDARVCIYERKLKADKIILSNKRSLASMASDKMRQMLYTGESTYKILSYLQRNYDADLIDEPEVVKSLIDMVEMRPESFSEMDDYLKVSPVCAVAARVYSDAYHYMDQDDFDCDDALLLQCVYTNPQIFECMDDEHKTNAVCVAAFEGDIDNYEFIPDEFKTVEMTRSYLFANPDGTSYVPADLKNHPDLTDLVLECNPYSVKEIDFRNLTHERCLKAVEEDGMVLSAIPFALLNYDICLEAVKSSSYAYSSVPVQYRDQKMASTLVEFHPECLADLPADLITYDMIERAVMDTSAHLTKLDFDSAHAGIRNLIVDNLEYLIAYDPMIVVHLPKSMVSNERALQAVETNDKVFWLINQEFTDLDFVVDAVKRGVAFRAIPRENLTMDLLKDLVRSRDGLIDEIPSRYLSDILYMVAIKAHNYDVAKIEKQFMTLSLRNFIATINPESEQAQNIREADLEMEIERSLMN